MNYKFFDNKRLNAEISIMKYHYPFAEIYIEDIRYWKVHMEFNGKIITFKITYPYTYPNDYPRLSYIKNNIETPICLHVHDWKPEYDNALRMTTVIAKWIKKHPYTI